MTKVNRVSVTTLFIRHRVLDFATFRIFGDNDVITFCPTDLVRTSQFPLALYTMFIRRTMLSRFRLRLSSHASGLASIRLINGGLNSTFVRRLLSTLIRLLNLREVNVLSVFRRFEERAQRSFRVGFFAKDRHVASLRISNVERASSVTNGDLIRRFLLLHRRDYEATRARRLSRASVLMINVAFRASKAGLRRDGAATVIEIRVNVSLRGRTKRDVLFQVSRPFRDQCEAKEEDSVSGTVRRLFCPRIVRNEAGGRKDGVSFRVDVSVRFEVGPFCRFSVKARLFYLSNVSVIFGFQTISVLGFRVLHRVLLAQDVRVRFLFVCVVSTARPLSRISQPTRQTRVSVRLLFSLIRRIRQILAITIRLVSGRSRKDLARATSFRRLANLNFRAFYNVSRSGGTVRDHRHAGHVFDRVLITKHVRSVSFVTKVVRDRRKNYSKSSALLFGFRPIKNDYLLSLIELCNSYRVGNASGRRRFFNGDHLANVQITSGDGHSSSLGLF